MSDREPLPDEFRGKYATQGVESTVRDADRNVIGHVGLFDLDEVALGVARDAADRLPDPTFVVRTSKRGFHAWSLAIRDVDEWIARGDALDGVDPEHVALNEARECSVCRISPKVELETGEHVRPTPRVIGRQDGDDVEGRVSLPHARILRDELSAEIGAILPHDVEEIAPGAEWVGHSAPKRSFLAKIGGGK